MNIAVPVLFVLSMIQPEAAKPQRARSCFQFSGDSYLQFTPNTFDNNNEIHYSLKFRTTQDNGILLYARGQYGDDEALYIKNGKLHYHLFNTSPSGVEGYFGAYLEGDESVNIDEWILVSIFRTWKPERRTRSRMRRKTGFEVEIDGERYPHVDYLERSDITILPTVYFGGYKESLSSVVGNFTGQIKDIFEEKNNYIFENPSLNYMSKVKLEC